jgi:fructose-1,6-bisphosphatase-3
LRLFPFSNLLLEREVIRVTISFEPNELLMLSALAAQFPTIDAALAETAALRATLDLPQPVVHVISDVHGEYKKLRHVINNASGTLRPFVEETFAERLSADELRELLAVLYYPREAMENLRPSLPEAKARFDWTARVLRRQFELIRALARTRRRSEVYALFPAAHRELFEELFDEACTRRSENYVNEMLRVYAARGHDFELVREASHVVRDLTVSELIVAGDLCDRGERGDKVIGYLMEQPNVRFVWGNHDASWMGACLGSDVCIATVVRISLRYRRLSQLEEGFGIIMSPLEKLAREVYGDDPAECFKTKGKGLRDDLLMARMQKAIAIIQFKLEAQASWRHPEWRMEHRNLLHRINFKDGTVEVDGKIYKMRDTFLPTVNPENPYELTDDEKMCLKRLRQSFIASERLWNAMLFVVKHGTMWMRRDDALIFHACVPVDEKGEMIPLEIDGMSLAGRAEFDAIENLIRRSFRAAAEHLDERDGDWFWYLWNGADSPLFGKDKMATFESYFIEDKSSQEEKKNPYFSMIHDAEFCKRIGREFGMSDDVLIVNGHVPVKIEKGEDPVKRSGCAVTIDGAFSEAYGDHGYTLILAPEGILLAEHYHFDSIQEAITKGADIVPKMRTLRAYNPPRKLSDTEAGEIVRQKIRALERLIIAYEEGALIENAPTEI